MTSKKTTSKQNGSREDYKVFVDKDNVIHILEKTQPDVEGTEKMKDETLRVARKLPKPRRLFVDLKGTERPPAGSRHAIVALLKSSEIDKVAVAGASTVNQIVSRFVMNAAGVKKAKFFDNEDEALAWLKKE